MGDASGNLGFERERLQYCERMYDVEKARGELLDRKAQVYLTLFAFLLGALSLKVDSWRQALLFTRRLWLDHPAVGIMLILEAALCMMAIASSLLAISMMLKPRARDKPYPKDLFYSLFNPKYEDANSLEEVLVKTTAKRYAQTVEINSRINTDISKWAVCLSASTIVALTTLYLLGATLGLAYWLY